MPHFNFKDKNIYYDVAGIGEPLLILNGIMMSTKSWDFMMDDLVDKFKVIRLDFIDQGQSDPMDKPYDQMLQIEIINELLKILNINKINLMGISYGGEVALTYSGLYPEKILKLMVFNTVSYTTGLLSNTGKLWNDAAELELAEEYYDLTIPVIYSKQFMTEQKAWIDERRKYLIDHVFNKKDFLDRMIRLTNSAENYDCRQYLERLNMPVMIIGSEKDKLTPLSHQQHLASQIKTASLVVLPNAGHASMYEEPLIFISLIIGFFNLKKDKYII